MDDAELVRQVVERVLQELRPRLQATPASPRGVAKEAPVLLGVSARHVHLCRADADVLFGKGHEFKTRNPLYQPGQFAAEETVALVGPKDSIRGVRVLLPLRSFSQVEVSRTDAVRLGLDPPVMVSADHRGSRILVLGPNGYVDLPSALIVPYRHIHASPEEAAAIGVRDGQLVDVQTEGPRAVIFSNVLVRVAAGMRLQLHLDADEANAADVGCREGQARLVIRSGGAI